MTLSSAIDAFADCHRVMTQALDDTRGVRVKFATYEKAAYFENRCSRLRILDRRDSRRTIGEDQPGYDCSEFDRLIIRKPRQSGELWYVYIEHVGIDIIEVEVLSKAPEIEYLPRERPKTIPLEQLMPLLQLTRRP